MRRAAKPMTEEEAQLDKAKREHVKRVVLAARRRAAGLEPEPTGIKPASAELDPYLHAQLELIEILIGESISEETGRPTKMGPLQFLFEVYNDANHDADTRVRAASRMLDYLHKRVPSALVVTPPDDPEGDAAMASDINQAVSALLSKVTGTKHRPNSPGLQQAIDRKKGQ